MMPTSFSYVKKGYNPVEVDNYIETLENIVKSYKEKDSAIKNAIINAQIAADNIIQDAEKRACDMFEQATKKVELIRNSISSQRTIVQSFQEDYNRLIDKYVTDFNQKDVLPVYASISDLEEYLTSLTSDFEETESLSKDDDVFLEKADPPKAKSAAEEESRDDADIAELLGRF